MEVSKCKIKVPADLLLVKTISDLQVSSFSFGMNLSTLPEIVKDREAWHAALHRVSKSQT